MFLKLDYATFQFDPEDMSRSRLSDLLTDKDLCWRSFGNIDNPRSVSEFGCSYWPNCGAPEREAMIQISGQGCTRFFDKLVDLREAAPNHLSRVDIAFETFVSREKWREMTMDAVFRYEQYLEDKEDGIVRRKSFSHSGSQNGSFTIYIGSRRSPYYFRIYNKTREDPSYKTLDSNGNYIDTPKDMYLVRWELEEKRFRRTRNGEKFLYDPSETFDLYFNDPAGLVEHLKKLWQSYCPDSFLPGIEFSVNDFDFETNLKFCEVRNDNFIAEWPDIVTDPVPCGKGINWVVDRFGKYVIWIANDPYLWNVCLQKFRSQWHFDPGLSVVRTTGSDVDDFDLSVFDKDPFTGEQLSLELPFEYINPHSLL